jgi:TRAP transporter TAXI family solute receptor
MKKFLALILAAAMIASTLIGCADTKKPAGSADGEHAPLTINFPTASSTGVLYSVGAAIANLWDTEIDYVSASSQASGGGIDNLGLVTDGEAQVSIAISSNCYECLNGVGTFAGYAYEDLKVIGGLYFNPNHVVVTEKSGITDLASVKGKHFAVGVAGSSIGGECQNHFTSAGLKYPDDINCEYINFGDAVDMLQNGNLDGAWIMAGVPAAAVTQATTAGCEILEIGDDVIADLKKDFPWYAPFTIPAGTYPNQNEDIQTSAVKMVMFCRGDLDEQAVYDLTKTLWENIDKLGETQAPLKGLTPAAAVQDIADLPLHPGAERYYKEIGVI